MRIDLPARKILDAVPDALIVADAAGAIVMANQTAEVLFGYSQEELVGMSIEDLMPQRFKAAHVLHRQHFLAHPRARAIGEKLEVALFCQRRDGTEFQAEISLGPFECDQGIFVATTVRDITTRALENQKFKQLLDSSADAMIVVNGKGEMVLVNAQTEALFGYPRQELLGNSVDMLLPDRYRATHSRHRDTFYASPRVRPMGQEPGHSALYGRKACGEEFQVEISLSPVQTADGLLISSAIRDISAHVEAERELAAAKEMAERANTSKSRFMAATGHDLRQPLQSLGLYLSAMSSISGSARQQEILGNMRQSLGTMSELLNALQDISQLESGAVVAERRDFFLHEIIAPVIADNIQQAQKKGLLLENVGIDCVVHSDPSLLKRIIENFVSNAVRYTEQGRITIDCQCNNDSARISVTDTGIGIPQEALQEIFREHYQIETGLRQQQQGMGLGLFIVEHIASLLEHPIHVSSTTGEGSTFALDIPLGTSKPAQKNRANINYHYAETSRDLTILFVDDDPTVVDAATMLLESAGAIVHSATNRDDALAHLRAGVYPDLVISDYRLPKYNGLEVVRHIRQTMVSDLPAVIMTGDTSTQEIEAANLVNCTVLHKPVDSDRLIEIMNSLRD